MVSWLCLMMAILGDPLYAVQENLRFSPPALTVPADWEWYGAARARLRGWQGSRQRLGLSDLLAPATDLAKPAEVSASPGLGQTSSPPEDEELRRLVDQDQIGPADEEILRPPEVPEGLLTPGGKQAPVDGSLAGLPQDLVRLMTEKADLDRIPVVAGWNLLSIPEEPADTDPAVVLGPVGGAYTRAYAYDACDTADPWKVYDPADPTVSDLTAIDHKIGFWLDGTAAGDLPSDGVLPATTTFDLCVGWNLIGFPAGQARQVTNALYTIEGKYLRVFGYDVTDPADPWEVYSVDAPDWANDLQRMEPGRGYWVLVTEATTLEIANQGADPVVEITAPADLDVVTTFTDVVGSVRSPLLEGWVLTYQLIGEGAPVVFAEGVTPVEQGVLGVFDPTVLLNGLYEIKLEATDLAGRVVEETLAVSVEGGLKLGNFTLSFVDLAVPVSGLDIQVIRTYDSRAKSLENDFGYGWGLEIKQGSYRNNRPPGDGWQIKKGFLPCESVQELKSHLTMIRLSEREIYRFRLRVTRPAPSLGGCFGEVGFDFVEGPNPGATLEILGGTEVFWENGGDRLIDINTFQIFEPDAVRLKTLDGRRIDLDIDLGVTALEDPAGNRVEISTEGITHSAGRSISFQRDTDGRIVSIVDPLGNSIHYSYDSRGDLTAVLNQEQESTRFGYENGHYLVSVEDPRGVVGARSDYDESGRLVAVTDTLGRSITFDHDLEGRREVVLDRLGHARVFEYDDRGNIVRETDASGVTLTKTFDDRGNVLTATNAQGATRTFEYDDNNHVVKEIDPLGKVTEFKYDGGRIVEVIDPLGRVTKQAYDAQGNLLSVLDPSGAELRFEYDSSGNMTKRTDSLGHATLLTYDSVGNVIEVEDPAGAETSYTYDAMGRRLTETKSVTTSSGPRTLSTSFEYDKLGRNTRITRPDGTVESASFDELGNIKSATDALGRTLTYHYDSMGRPVETLYPDGTTEVVTYDPEGRVVRTQDRAGRITEAAYDAANRPTVRTFSDGTTVTAVYDRAGRPIQVTDNRGHVTTYQYDAAGRRIGITDAEGNQMSFQYDDAGQLLSVTGPTGGVISVEYDAAGRATRTVLPDGTTQEVRYDLAGRRVADLDAAGRVTRYSYDPGGRLAGVKDALGQTTRFEYDELGRRTAQIDAAGRITRVEFDAMGRAVKRILPGGDFEAFSYDAEGSLISARNAAGQTIQLVRNVNGQILERIYPEGSSVDFAYGANGKRSSVTDARGQTTYEYDLRDRLTRVALPNGHSIEYAYDENGNRTEVAAILSGGIRLVTSYAYDELNRLSSVTGPDGGTYAYSYDGNSNLKQLGFPNGVETAYSYDSLDRLVDLTTTQTASGDVVQSYHLTLDETGNRTRVEELDGKLRDFTFDPLSKLLSEAVTDAVGQQEFRNDFQYDVVGNRTRRTHQERGQEETTLYSYDQRDRLVEAGGVEFRWDAAGNLLAKADQMELGWDVDGRLTRITAADGTVVRNTYDADGVLVRREETAPGGTSEVRNLLVDTSSGVSQLLAETDDDGNLMAYYVRGGRPLALDGVEKRYFLTDFLGSVTGLMDEQGVVTDRYSYSAFGETWSEVGETENPLRYAGEVRDPVGELYYNRSRWLDPAVGRFLSADTFAGFSSRPLSLNKYLYADANPVMNTDPSGRFSAAGQIATVAAIGMIASIGLGVYFGYRSLTSFPPGAFMEWPDALVIGLQLSATPGRFFRMFRNPIGIGLSLGLIFTGVFAAVEVLIPFKSMNTLWVYLVGGVSIGIQNLNRAASATLYAGVAYRVKEPGDYTEWFWCTTVNPAQLVKPKGIPVNFCSSKDSQTGKPGAYSAVFPIAKPTRYQSVMSSGSYYQYLGTEIVLEMPALPSPMDTLQAFHDWVSRLAEDMVPIPPR